MTVHACGALDGTHYLAMEAIDGPSLAERLAHEPPLTTDEIRRIFRELLTGLATAHDAGLVHRDIKSSNILLDGPDQRVKIADFGLARITASHTRITMPQSAIGTPEYMSPEQARGDENVDHRTDLYSAGVVLYEMLTGRVPFRGESASAIIHHILHHEPAEPRQISTKCDRALSRLAVLLMSKRPGDRPGLAQEVLQLLERPTHLRWALSKSPKRRFARLTAISVVIGLGALLAWTATGDRLSTDHSRPKPDLVEIEVERDESGGPTARLRARYGDNLDWMRFHSFPGTDHQIYSLLKFERRNGETVVLAGLVPPLDGAGLWGLDAKGRELWRTDLTVPVAWPDIGPTTQFVAVKLLPLPEGASKTGRVLVAAADHRLYPSYLAVLDEESGLLSHRLWHLGHINNAAVAADLFGPNRPGIIVTASNNKLDGFDESRPGDWPPVTPFDWVPVLMVLDIAALEGDQLINIPPSNGRVPNLTSILPHAYRYLIGAANANAARTDHATGEVSTAGPDGALTLELLGVKRCHADSSIEQCFEVAINRGEKGFGGGLFVLNASLDIVDFSPNLTELQGRTLEFWADRFPLLVEDGRLVPSHP